MDGKIASRLFQEILNAEQERNQILIDSSYKVFAFSDDKVFDIALERFDKVMAESVAEFVVKGVNSGFNG